MIGELDFGGVFVPAALVAAFAGLAVSLVIRRLFGIFGLYRLVWHRGLFDFALFILLWGVFAQHFLSHLSLFPPLFPQHWFFR